MIFSDETFYAWLYKRAPEVIQNLTLLEEMSRRFRRGETIILITNDGKMERIGSV